MLNVGIIGLGVMGRSHAEIYDRIPGVTVKAVCDSQPDTLAEVAQRYRAEAYEDFHRLLSDKGIDAVSICMPDNLHVEAVLAAVRAGKHILVEKPLADTLENARRIHDAVQGYDKVFTIGYNLRHDTRYTRAKDAIDKGEIGQIVHMSCRRNSGIGGPLRFIGHSDLSMHVMVHDINIINWLMPSDPVRVYARRRDLVLREHGMTDTILAIITYADGSIVSMEACWIMSRSWPSAVDDQLEVVGTQGVLYIEGCDQGFCMVNDSGVKRPDTRYRPIVNGHYAGALGEELLCFAGRIQSRGTPIVNASEGLMDLRVVDAIERSVRSGREEEI